MELQDVFTFGLADDNRAAEIEAERLEQLAHTLAYRIGQRPIAPDNTSAGATSHGLFDHAVTAQFPERNLCDRHHRYLLRRPGGQPRQSRRSPRNRSRKRKRLRKSRDSASAPMMAYEPPRSRGTSSAICLSRWASHAVRPVKTITPTTEIKNCSASLCQNSPTIDASTRPIKPMNMNWPMPARLREVVVP